VTPLNAKGTGGQLPSKKQVTKEGEN